MNEKVFLDQINRLINAFGANAFGIEKTKRIKALLGTIPPHGFIEVVNTLLDNFRHAPTPSEIHSAVKAWMRANPQHYDVVDVPRPLECSDCYETGWLYFDSLDYGSSMMFCHCQHGSVRKSGTTAPIPQFERGRFERAFGFTRKPFPKEKFTPCSDESKRIFSRKESDIVDWWKDEQLKAFKFWIEINERNNAGEIAMTESRNHSPGPA